MSSADPEPLTPDSVFELLSNHRRRMVLYCLRTSGGSIDMQDLAEQIASMENDVPAEELTSQQRKRVYVSLYQTHLPKMAEMGAVEYDKDGGVVQLTDRTDEIDKYLTTRDRSTYPWAFHYLLLAVGGAIAVAFAALNFPVFGGVPILALCGVVLVALAGSAVGQYRYVQRREETIPVELSQYE